MIVVDFYSCICTYNVGVYAAVVGQGDQKQWAVTVCARDDNQEVRLTSLSDYLHTMHRDVYIYIYIS